MEDMMRVKFRKSSWLSNWYVIEPVRGTGQPEGTAEEWRAILAAMRRREGEGFYRVAVEFDDEGRAVFHSPRNSTSDEVEIEAVEIDAWVDYAESILELNETRNGTNEQTGS